MIIYTDGSAHPNPGPGGFGVVVLDNCQNLIACYSEQTEYTTNNREELKGILWAMKNYGLKFDECYPNQVNTDSAYSYNSLSKWIYTWRDAGWKKMSRGKDGPQPPENLDLLKEYNDYLTNGYLIELNLVKGHCNHKWNDLADALATGRLTPEEALKLYK